MTSGRSILAQVRQDVPDLVINTDYLPGIALPVAGGVLFTVLIGVWLTSGLWFISENGFPAP